MISICMVQTCGSPRKRDEVLGARQTVGCQTDGWSCGYHAARILEVKRRQLRGEQLTRVLGIAAYQYHNKDLVLKLQALQAKYKGVPWPPKKPEGKEGPENNEDKKDAKDQGPGDKGEAGKRDEAGKNDSELVKGSLAEALAKASKCTSCKPRKTGPFAGKKGCLKCMGDAHGL